MVWLDLQSEIGGTDGVSRRRGELGTLKNINFLCERLYLKEQSHSDIYITSRPKHFFFNQVR